MSSYYQRDIVIKSIFEKAKINKDIFFISADFGAPALDQFRDELPSQFIHSGISEQNTVDLAAGLALEGRTVFVYAMAPFVSLRCLEQHKCATGIMNLNVCTLVAGIGLGYADAGPTHYATEDLSCLHALIGSEVNTISDPSIAKLITDDITQNPRYSFVRMDRHPTPILDEHFSNINFKDGYRFDDPDSSICVISTGGIVNNVISAKKSVDKSFTICDIFRTKPLSKNLLMFLDNFDKILCVDEQSTGGLLHSILEGFNTYKITKHVVDLKLPELYIYDNGGRDFLLDKHNLSPAKIAGTINNLL